MAKVRAASSFQTWVSVREPFQQRFSLSNSLSHTAEREYGCLSTYIQYEFSKYNIQSSPTLLAPLKRNAEDRDGGKSWSALIYFHVQHPYLAVDHGMVISVCWPVSDRASSLE